MSDKENPHSGSRWEPAAESGPQGDPEPEGGQQPVKEPVNESATASASAPPPPPGPTPAAAPEPAPAPGKRPRLQRHWIALAGAAAGLVLISGGTGFAIGHATADDGSRVSNSRQFGPGQGRFPGGPGGERDEAGEFGEHGFPDRDGDGDHGGRQGFPPGQGQGQQQGNGTAPGGANPTPTPITGGGNTSGQPAT